MVNKKYLLLAGLCSVLAVQPALAQESESANASWSGRDMTYRGENYDVLDSSYYPKHRLPQYRKYVNHQTPFPPKPSNQWEVGVNVGFFNIFGDVPSNSPFTATKFTNAIGYGLTVRKSLGYVLSARFQFLHGVGSGLEYRYAQATNPVYNQPNFYGGGRVYHNYRTTYNEFSLQLVAATNNIRFHKGKNSFSLYALIGGGIATYNPKLNLLNSANGNATYAAEYATINATHGRVSYKDRKKVQKAIKDVLDDSYETDAYKDSHAGGSGNLVPILTAGVGFQFRLGKTVTLQFEDKISLPFRDGLDGVILQPNNSSLTPDKDLVNYASIGLNFNIGNRSKTVAPLWWVNPLDHAYNELSNPRHMQLPEPTISDSDGDGIADMFDKCPGTPAGVAVDSKGCPLDTDGDGVPDYKDKQLITPTECQPVDADGVGKCPCPDGCGTASAAACSNIGAGSLIFSGNSSKISSAMQAQLANLAAQLSANPTCKAVIIGSGNASKVQQQRSWDRVNAVIEYMSEKHGIDRNRFIFQYGAAGDANTVMYRAANAGEEGPANVAPPFPNLRRN